MEVGLSSNSDAIWMALLPNKKKITQKIYCLLDKPLPTENRIHQEPDPLPSKSHYLANLELLHQLQGCSSNNTVGFLQLTTSEKKEC